MFEIIGIVFFALGLIPLLLTVKNMKKYPQGAAIKKLRIAAWVIAADLLIIVLFNLFAYFYTEFLWFDSLGYSDRFFTVLVTIMWMFIAGFLISWLFIKLNLNSALKTSGGGKVTAINISIILGAIILGIYASNLWMKYLLFVNQAPSQSAEPVFGKSMGFYLFTLPFLNGIAAWLGYLIIFAAIGIVMLWFYDIGGYRDGQVIRRDGSVKAIGQFLGNFFFLAGLMFFVAAFNSYLSIFELMYTSEGAVKGVGFVDEHFRKLGYIVSVIVYALLGAALAAASFSKGFRKKALGITASGAMRRTWVIAGTAAAVVVFFTWALPEAVSVIYLKPNEITLEKPYLKHNIKFTRAGYGLLDSRITTKEYSPGRDLSTAALSQNRDTLANVRLWDWRALMDNLKQQQEIRLYYEFNDVDIDRYHFGGDYTQVMLSVREMEKSNLDIKSQTWVSRHFKYTHGYGLVMLPVNKFIGQGKPKLLVKNIPSTETVESFSVERPEIYYGERTRDHVYVKTKQKEFDYPLGGKNVYSEYEGKGGVPIPGFLKKIFYAWKFDGHRILFSAYFDKESRVMFRRNILERAARIAPFLVFDRDPYAMVSKEGRIKYILDAYTVSDKYPYSEQYRGDLYHLWGNNYMRNSVKAVIDSYDGTVDFYVADKDDIIIKTYNRIFPGVFKSMEEMEGDIRKHIRYPDDFLRIQAKMYNTYHMTDPEVFYQREDVWEFATEKYRENFQEINPYYVMLNFPGKKNPEFTLMVPFTPKNKNVMNAWLAGRCDFPDYGNLVVYTFPKGVEVLGPRQIEARIDQDTEMSEAMTLWGQRGSRVIRGNLLAIPLFDKEELYIMYVEPVYLQADNASLPEIKRVVVADQEKVVWAETFDKALKKLLSR